MCTSFFFFKQKTAYEMRISDWSSDVCSSDLLAHPEPGFTIVGAQSYGRAPTFLMATGYEQVRSVVAQLAGDRTAARQMRLVLPETGFCHSKRIAALAAAVVATGCTAAPPLTTAHHRLAHEPTLQQPGGKNHSS